MIYLDNAATTGRKPESVIQAVSDGMLDWSINAGRGSYQRARQAAHLIDECKERILHLAKLRSGYGVYFAPSATVALNQLILGLPCDDYATIYVSPFEHNAVMRPVHALCCSKGSRWQQLPFEQDSWQFDAVGAEGMFLERKPDYVILTMVSNTTGFILPVGEITALAHRYGAKVIVDCSQALGSIDADLSVIGADAYVFAGHKTLYGPFGVAGTILSKRWMVSSGIFGGTGSDSLNLAMPSPANGGLEPGSPNLPAIAGLNAALQWIDEVGPAAIERHERTLVNALAERLNTLPPCKLYLPPAEKRSSMIAFAMDGYRSDEVGEILDDEFGICVRTGYQCAPLVHDWLGTKPYGGIVRISFSYFNTQEDAASAYDAIAAL